MIDGDSMKILLVRHGQTNINKEKRIQGRTNNPLNDDGIKQAHIIGRFLKSKNFKFDSAYSSSLSRAYKTGEIVLSYLKNPTSIIVDDNFIERDFGPFEGQLAAPVIEIIQSIPNFSKEGFEDNKKLEKRVLSGIKQIYQKEKGKNVILFCHSHVIKPLLIAVDKEKFNYSTFLENGSSHLFSYDGKNIKLLQFNLVSP